MPSTTLSLKQEVIRKRTNDFKLSLLIEVSLKARPHLGLTNKALETQERATVEEEINQAPSNLLIRTVGSANWAPARTARKP